MANPKDKDVDQPVDPDTIPPDDMEGDDVDEDVRTDPGPIDRVTNQPLSDFMPAAANPEFGDSVRMTNDALSFATGNARARVAANTEAARAAAAENKKTAEAQLKEVEKTTKEMFKDITVVPPELYAARERARIAVEARANTASTTIPGGRFMVNGKWVNAYGDEIG